MFVYVFALPHTLRAVENCIKSQTEIADEQETNTNSTEAATTTTTTTTTKQKNEQANVTKHEPETRDPKKKIKWMETGEPNV